MIVVCPLHKVASVVEDHAPSHAISLLGDDHEMPTIPSLAAGNHLKLSFNDISVPMDGYVAPGEADVKTLVNFIRGWERQAPLLIHCWAGVSRSTAAAYIAQCLLAPEEDELTLARNLRAASPSATPNKLMVIHADLLLGRGGRMADAVAAIGRGADAWEGNVFQLSVS
ncbi:MAG: protein tyrosine phosphatase [Rhizobiales bacterium]|nr:protein tyrosine phosphatase [Hyphomicrobiales bacterium]